MPATPDEAQQIVEIMDRYLNPDDAKRLTYELYSKVGGATSNESLRVTLHMLFAIYNQQAGTKEREAIYRSYNGDKSH